MLLELTSDQELFRQNTAKFIADRAPVSEVRRLRHDPAGFDREYWRQGAALGWTSLLVDESHGGGSISGRGLVDLTLVAHEFGFHAAPGPLVDTNLVAAALSAGGDDHRDVLDSLLSGNEVASWCRASLRIDRHEVVLDGTARPVESAAQAGHLLVTGSTDDGVTQVLVPAHAPGVAVKPLQTVDLTRRFSEVSFHDVRVPVSAVVGGIGTAAGQVERQLQTAAVILVAESVGAMQASFDMTVEWAFDRYTFGRPLASYQALKHRFANMKSWLEASHALSDAAAAAVQDGVPDAAELASVAKAFVGDYGTELAHECVQMHGGIGLTYDHDLHLYLRRVTLDQTLYGTPAEHRERLVALVEQQEPAA